MIEGDKRARVHQTNGVKQGCPLSSLLFPLDINDMGRDIIEGIRGPMTGDGVNGVLYLLYADDLIANEPRGDANSVEQVVGICNEKRAVC
eukprot:1139962-Pelagomonas_calceolata.AAC.1